MENEDFKALNWGLARWTSEISGLRSEQICWIIADRKSKWIWRARSATDAEEKMHSRYFLMLTSGFDILVSCLQPVISQCQCTLSMPTVFNQRLAIILRVCASGWGSRQAAAAGWKRASNTASSIILQACEASCEDSNKCTCFRASLVSLPSICSMLTLQDPRNARQTGKAIRSCCRVHGWTCSSRYSRTPTVMCILQGYSIALMQRN